MNRIRIIFKNIYNKVSKIFNVIFIVNEIFIPFLNDIYQNINLSIQVLYQKKSYQKLSHNLQKKKEKFLILFSS